MDGYYYCAPNLEAERTFQSFDLRKRIDEVAKVFIPGIFKRRYGENAQFGTPYLTGADIFTLSPSSQKFLLHSVAEQYDLILQKGMIAIQEAGQVNGIIGRAVLIGDYLDGFACSNNMARITPHDSSDAGYIYSSLSSEFGVRLVKRESSGSSIPHLDRSRIASIEIPWPSRQIRLEIGSGVVEAIRLRDEANIIEKSAISIVEVAIEENA
jgi:type I restriction enzyme S subunit